MGFPSREEAAFEPAVVEKAAVEAETQQALERAAVRQSLSAAAARAWEEHGQLAGEEEAVQNARRSVLCKEAGT